MTLEEAKRLRLAEKTGVLRKPNCMIADVKSDLESICDLLWYIENSLTANIRTDVFKSKLVNKLVFNPANKLLTKLVVKAIARKNIKHHQDIKSFTGKGTIKNPYHIVTRFGEGNYFKAGELFVEKKLPNDIKRKQCFANCINEVCNIATNNDSAKILAGISYYDKPYLHAVVHVVNKEGKPIIVDYNYNLAMDAELYLKLFSFEVLNEVEGTELLRDYDLLAKKTKNVSVLYHCFAYDDLVKRARNDDIDPSADWGDVKGV